MPGEVCPGAILNRGRVIRADAAMEPASGPLPEVTVEGDCTHEDAGRLMVQPGTTRLAVRDKATGRPAGTLSMERILAAITQRSQERA
jgi:CBS domain-containing protein